jgi:hypothetical protein
MYSSLALFNKKVLLVSGITGQGATEEHLEQAGGPGNKTSLGPDKPGPDKKHGSYTRYLSRRVGGELRKMRTPQVMNRPALIHQPRNRSGTGVACVNEVNHTSKPSIDFTNKDCCSKRIS